MASKRENIMLESTESSYRYTSQKNKTATPKRIELMKFDPTPGVRKHVLFKEKK